MKERELFLLSIALVSDAQLNGAQKLFDDHWARAQISAHFSAQNGAIFFIFR